MGRKAAQGGGGCAPSRTECKILGFLHLIFSVCSWCSSLYSCQCVIIKLMMKCCVQISHANKILQTECHWSLYKILG